MRIDPKICITKQQKVVACYCSTTGIASALIVPAISGQVFEYVHPLSYWANCSGMIKQGQEYLKSLEPQILSGLFISSYTHFELLDLGELTATEANAILCTASPASLVEALELVPLFTKQNTCASPIFALNWGNLQDQIDVNRELTSIIRNIAKDFKNPTSAIDKTQHMITVLNRDAMERRLTNGYVALSSAKVTLSDSEKDFEVDFKNWKKSAKRLIKALGDSEAISAEFVAFLNTVTKDRNLVTMSQSLREKIAAKLTDKNVPDATTLAKIILDCANPYDIEIQEAPLNATALDASAKRIRSLKDILADKKRKSQIVGTTVEATEELFAAQNNVGGQSVEDYDAEVDAEDEEGEDMALIAVDDKFAIFNAPSSITSEDF